MPKLCKSYLCPQCAGWLQIAARKVIEHGSFRRLDDGLRPVMFTLTEPANATLDLAGFAARHKATLKRFKRRGWVESNCTVVEFQRRGALHPHIVARVPRELHALVENHDTPSSYRFRMHELRPLAVELGWGQMVDVRGVDGGVGQYTVKSLGSYLGKEARRRFKEVGAERVRPVRPARSWVPGGLTAAMRGEDADPGPWRDVDVGRGRSCG